MELRQGSRLSLPTGEYFVYGPRTGHTPPARRADHHSAVTVCTIDNKNNIFEISRSDRIIAWTILRDWSSTSPRQLVLSCRSSRCARTPN